MMAIYICVLYDFLVCPDISAIFFLVQGKMLSVYFAKHIEISPPCKAKIHELSGFGPLSTKSTKCICNVLCLLFYQL